MCQAFETRLQTKTQRPILGALSFLFFVVELVLKRIEIQLAFEIVRGAANFAHDLADLTRQFGHFVGAEQNQHQQDNY